jgi:hypothetical protein
VRSFSFIQKHIRVHGLDSQSHIINVENIKSANDIRRKILAKFGHRNIDDWEILISVTEDCIFF